MPSFKPVIQRQRKDGLIPVYIRVIHNRKAGLINTSKVVTKKSLSKSLEILDSKVLTYCELLIAEYNRKLSGICIDDWTVNEVISFITTEENDASFSDYAQLYIKRIVAQGYLRKAKDYQRAVKSLEEDVALSPVMFSHLTPQTIGKWIKSLELKKMAKEKYPIWVRQIFNDAVAELNDTETGVNVIKSDPWPYVEIPKADKTENVAISAEQCRDFFNHLLPESKMLNPITEISRDVAKLVLCLGGINTADLFLLKRADYKDGIIRYQRVKNRNSRSGELYFEMRVEPFVKPIVDKYLSDDHDQFLFNFHKRYCDTDSFSANVNRGLKEICKDMQIPKELYYNMYTFRHTWSAIAQNDCGADLTDVVLGLYHKKEKKQTQENSVTDFHKIWDLNARVIDFIFKNKEKSRKGQARYIDEPQGKLFRITDKSMIEATATLKGAELASVKGIGFRTIDAVIEALVLNLPASIPIGCCVKFRIRNCDTNTEEVYERSKGKGFN